MGRIGTVTLDFPVTDDGLVACPMVYREGYVQGDNCQWIPVDVAPVDGAVLRLPPPTPANTHCLVGHWDDVIGACVTDDGYAVDTRVYFGGPVTGNPVNPNHTESGYPWWMWALLAVGGLMVLRKSQS